MSCNKGELRDTLTTRFLGSPMHTLQARLNNFERYNKMKESRERCRLRLDAATAEIKRLEAELALAKAQADTGGEAQVRWRWRAGSQLLRELSL